MPVGGQGIGAFGGGKLRGDPSEGGQSGGAKSAEVGEIEGFAAAADFLAMTGVEVGD